MTDPGVIEAVLFDLDGTLLDSAPDLVATLNHLRAGFGLAAIPVDDLRPFVSHGAAGLIKAGMPPCDDETMASWRQAFLEHYAQNSMVDSRPFDGVDPVLAELSQRSVPWGVVTNKLEFLTYPILEHLGWMSSVAAVVCGDSVSRSKPHPEPVLAACENIGVSPAQTLLVGDDRRDIQAGHTAGARTVLAMYGYAATECHDEMSSNTARINAPGEVIGLLDPDEWP